MPPHPSPPQPSPDATNLYCGHLCILMTERGGTITFCRVLAPPQCPPSPHSPDATIRVYLNDRERGRRYFLLDFGAAPPPPPQTPQYLTILMTQSGRHYVCRILAPQIPPPPPHTTPQCL